MSAETLLVIAIYYMFLLVVVLVVALRAGGEADGDAGRDGGGGGAIPRGPTRPPGAPGLDGRPWWPEFEREFADYVAARLRSSARGPAPSACGGESVGRAVTALARDL